MASFPRAGSRCAAGCGPRIRKVGAEGLAASAATATAIRASRELARSSDFELSGPRTRCAAAACCRTATACCRASTTRRNATRLGRNDGDGYDEEVRLERRSVETIMLL